MQLVSEDIEAGKSTVASSEVMLGALWIEVTMDRKKEERGGGGGRRVRIGGKKWICLVNIVGFKIRGGPRE